MKRILIALAFLASTVWAAPAIQSSQFTAFNSNTPTLAVPAGPVGDVLLAVIALPCTNSGGLNGPVAGWTVILNASGPCGMVSLARVSDGTESGVTVAVNNPDPAKTGVGLVLRVSGAVGLPVAGPINNLSSMGSSIGPNAPPTAAVPGGAQDVLWLTFANSLQPPVLAPSGYDNILSQSNGYIFNAYMNGGTPLDVVLMISQRSSTEVGSYREDAGPWTLVASRPWRAQTIGIR